MKRIHFCVFRIPFKKRNDNGLFTTCTCLLCFVRIVLVSTAYVKITIAFQARHGHGSDTVRNCTFGRSANDKRGWTVVLSFSNILIMIYNERDRLSGVFKFNHRYYLNSEHVHFSIQGVVLFNGIYANIFTLYSLFLSNCKLPPTVYLDQSKFN